MTGLPHGGACLPSDEETARMAVSDEAARPVWFGEAGQNVFGLYHAPAEGDGGLAIVLCNPFGYEAMCTHRAYLHLALSLVRRGFPVLRFDYHGTGDSAGDDDDPERWTGWQRSVQAAIDKVRALSGCAHVGAFGARLGANLALAACADRHDVVAFALWGPFATGRAFLREELAVHRLRALDSVKNPGAPVHDGVEALGFAISSGTRAALEAHVVADLASLGAGSVLVVTRDTPLQEQQVAGSLTRLGATVSYVVGAEYDAMVQDLATPEATWARVAEFFDRCRRDLPTTVPGPREPLADVATATLWCPGGQVKVSEVASYVGPRGDLFGITTRPLDAGAAEKRAVLLINGGENHHVGQNRWYTRWARTWAEAGFTTLRVDLGGLGDSRPFEGSGADRLHSPGRVDDVRAAIDYLAVAFGYQEFAVIGLCSGALISFCAALSDARIKRLGLLSWTGFALVPDAHSGPDADDSAVPKAAPGRGYRALRYYLQKARAPSTWRRTLRGEVDWRGIAGHVARLAFTRVRSHVRHLLPARLGEPAAQRATLSRDFQALASRGVRACVVYGGAEPAQDELLGQLGPQLRRLKRRGCPQLEVLDGADHVFTPLWAQRHVFELMTKHVVES